MKTLLAALLTLATASPAAAQNVYINQPDGQLVLEQEKCQSGGRQASFIESRSNGGGAYGCWEAKDGYVYVRWSQLVGPTGSILNIDKVMRYEATGRPLEPTGKVMKLIELADKEAVNCQVKRTRQACNAFAEAFDAVQRQGWCWGPDGIPNDQRRWMRCQ